MEVIIRGKPKEIAALVLAVQERRDMVNEESGRFELITSNIDAEELAKLVLKEETKLARTRGNSSIPI